jgi:hypothetical protein
MKAIGSSEKAVARLWHVVKAKEGIKPPEMAFARVSTKSRKELRFLEMALDSSTIPTQKTVFPGQGSRSRS